LFFRDPSDVKLVLPGELRVYYVPGFLFLDDIFKGSNGCLDGTRDGLSSVERRRGEAYKRSRKIFECWDLGS